MMVSLSLLTNTISGWSQVGKMSGGTVELALLIHFPLVRLLINSLPIGSLFQFNTIMHGKHCLIIQQNINDTHASSYSNDERIRLPEASNLRIMPNRAGANSVLRVIHSPWWPFGFAAIILTMSYRCNVLEQQARCGKTLVFMYRTIVSVYC